MFGAMALVVDEREELDIMRAGVWEARLKKLWVNLHESDVSLYDDCMQETYLRYNLV